MTPEGVERLTAQADARPVVLWPLAAFSADSHCHWQAFPPDRARRELRARVDPEAPNVLPGTLRGCPHRPGGARERARPGDGDRYIFAVLHAGCCAT